MSIQLLQLQAHAEDRGTLIALQEGKNIPFAIKCVYHMLNTGEGVRCGYHAH
jgi:hypothetical protein